MCIRLEPSPPCRSSFSITHARASCARLPPRVEDTRIFIDVRRQFVHVTVIIRLLHLTTAPTTTMRCDAYLDSSRRFVMAVKQ